MNKERIALALSVLSRRLKLKDMDADELVLLGCERSFDYDDKDNTAAYYRSTLTKAEVVAMAEAIILDALTANDKQGEERNG